MAQPLDLLDIFVSFTINLFSISIFRDLFLCLCCIALVYELWKVLKPF